jgi:integrase
MNNLYIPVELPESKIVSPNTHFAVYSDLWIEENKSRIAIKTRLRYQNLLLRINEGIGHIPLNQIKRQHLMKFYDNLKQNGVNKRTGGGLENKTIAHHHKLIQTILNTAIRDGILSTNPAAFAFNMKVKSKEPEILTASEIETLNNLLKFEPPKWSAAVHVTLATGIRNGELMGLEWRDINFDDGYIFIKRVSQYTTETGIFTKEPKNKSSVRVFTVSKKLLELLIEYRKTYETEYGNSNPQNRLFCKKDGTPMHPDSFGDWIKKFCLRTHFRSFSPHVLRHTHISLLIANRVPITAVSKRAGHSQVSTTCNVYAHSVQATEAVTAGTIDEYFLGN